MRKGLALVLQLEKTMNSARRYLSVALSLAIALAACSALSGMAHATTITFDDIAAVDVVGATGCNGCELPIADGYAGLNWVNIDANDGSFLRQYCPGCLDGLVSPSNDARNGSRSGAEFYLPDQKASNTFSLVSGYFTTDAPGEWVQVIGLLDGQIVGPGGSCIPNSPLSDCAVFYPGTSPTLVNFNWAGINGVEINAETDFIIDDVTVNFATPTPEPGTLSCMLSGLGLLALGLRRRGSMGRSLKA